LRPILSITGASAYHLAKYLARISMKKCCGKVKLSLCLMN
jgi:hypothetical protein